MEGLAIVPFGDAPGLVVPPLVVEDEELPFTEPLAPEPIDAPDVVPDPARLRRELRVVVVEAPELGPAVIPGSLMVEPEVDPGVMPVPLLMPVPVEPDDTVPDVMPLVLPAEI